MVINGFQFNQDGSCFTASLDKGYRIYNTQPLKKHIAVDTGNEGFSVTCMLFRSNYLALVGGGKRPKFSPNKVLIWDDYKQKFILGTCTIFRIFLLY